MPLRRFRRRTATVIAVATLASGLRLASDAYAAPVVPTGFREEILVTNLDQPNGFAFLPDGRLVFTEQQTGNIRVVLANFALMSTPAYTVGNVVTDNTERGLQGVAVDPRWPSPAYIYVQFNHTGNQEWIMRLTGVGDVSDPLGPNLSFGDPLILIHNIRDAFGNHNGGTLRFGPDGYLYSTTGEDSAPCASQQVDSLLGKVLRMDVTRLPAGPGGPVPRALLIPPDNPISSADSNASLVYAYGFRNPWRMHIDPETGIVYVADVGENVEEEIDEVEPGRNYGWPFREGSLIHTVGGCTEPGGPGGSSYASPVVTLDHATTEYTALETATVYRPVPGGVANWPTEYWGNLFFGDYYLSRLRRLVKTGTTWAYAAPVPGQPLPEEWSDGMYWATDFLVGPDGSLYWLKAWDDSFRPSSGMIRRIRYLGGTTAVGPSRASSTGLGCAPNPFASAVELSGSFAAGARVRVAVYDAAGRRVREAVAREAEPGRFVWTWDGRDETGIAAPPGIYLARFDSGAAALTARVLRVR
jgi:glucose/arabinose dehydrogenase